MQETKACQNCHNDFIIKPEDFQFYEKIDVPAPTFCPECRLINRMIWRNEKSLYKKQCDLCQKPTFSMYDDVPFPVYCPECWRSDNWNPMDYAQEYDLNRGFFDQLKELFGRVPRMALLQISTVKDVQFANYIANSNNVYLAYSIVASENIKYSHNVDQSKNVVDSYGVTNVELVYENFQCSDTYSSTYLSNSKKCMESHFLFDCVNCQNCFMSANLRNKNYVFRGQQLSKVEYEEKIEALNFGLYTETKKLVDEFIELQKDSIHKYANLVNCINSTGDNLSSCKNVGYCFNGVGIEVSKYCNRIVNGAKDCYDLSGATQPEMCCELVGGTYAPNNCVASYYSG